MKYEYFVISLACEGFLGECIQVRSVRNNKVYWRLSAINYGSTSLFVDQSSSVLSCTRFFHHQIDHIVN